MSPRRGEAKEGGEKILFELNQTKEGGKKIPLELNCCIVVYTYLITKKSTSRHVQCHRKRQCHHPNNEGISHSLAHVLHEPTIFCFLIMFYIY